MMSPVREQREFATETQRAQRKKIRRDSNEANAEIPRAKALS